MWLIAEAVLALLWAGLVFGPLVVVVGMVGVGLILFWHVLDPWE